tara:strand:- start:599 stop:1258 length:660 start_codon:yes stop_codon:yes gene_type:complete
MSPLAIIITLGAFFVLLTGLITFLLKGSFIKINHQGSELSKYNNLILKMNPFIKYYVLTIDWICEKIGRITMYLVFIMMAILILSFVTRNIINFPLLWIIEMAQFTMTAYYLLGGGFSMLMDDHVRMDLFYSKFSERNKARMDALTSIFLIFYLIVLLYGSITSLIYTLETNQRLFTAWAPYVWPIKVLMLIGIFLMLLQSISMFFKDIYKASEAKEAS